MNTKPNTRSTKTQVPRSGMSRLAHGLLAALALGTLAATLTGCGPSNDPEPATLVGPHGKDPKDPEPCGDQVKFKPGCGGPVIPSPKPGQHDALKFSYHVPQTLPRDPHSPDGHGIVEPASGVLKSKPYLVYDACAAGKNASVDSYLWTFDDGTDPVTANICQIQVPRVLSSTWHQLNATLTAHYTDGTSATVTRPVKYRDLVVASMGDSAASGEGDPDHPGIRRGSFSNMDCDRSGWAGSARAAWDLQDASTSVTFWHVACASARITSDDPTSRAASSVEQGGMMSPFSGSHHTRKKYPIESQVDQLQKLARDINRPVDAALFMAGANDVEWASAAIDCYKVGPVCMIAWDPVLRRRLNILPGRLTRLGQKLDSLTLADGSPVVTRSHVYMTEYFDPVHDASPGGLAADCPAGGFGLIKSLPREVREWAATKVQGPLDDKLRAASLNEGWHFIDGITKAFHDHGLCAPANQRWITTPIESHVRQPYAKVLDPLYTDDINGAWHANDIGQRKMAEIIGRDLQFLPEGLPLPPRPSQPKPTHKPEPKPKPEPKVCHVKPYLPQCRGDIA